MMYLVSNKNKLLSKFEIVGAKAVPRGTNIYIEQPAASYSESRYLIKRQTVRVQASLFVKSTNAGAMY